MDHFFIFSQKMETNMFDKNAFKQKFRLWVEQNVDAPLPAARLFCECLIPDEERQRYAWLLEESLEWFRWLQKTPSPCERLNENSDDTSN